jgi:hypothetical protein
MASRLNSAQPTAGVSFELDAIAAVVLGGTSLSGGVGTIGGTLIGALIIGMLDNGLNLLNVSSFYQQVAKGLVILLAVFLDKKNADKGGGCGTGRRSVSTFIINFREEFIVFQKMSKKSVWLMLLLVVFSVSALLDWLWQYETRACC